MRDKARQKIYSVLRWIAAVFVIASMLFQGLAESWLWLATLTVFLGAWIFLEKYLDEIDHRKFWQGIAQEQAHRHRKKTT